MFKWNDTQDFMDAVFTPLDHTFIMQKAWEVDASGLEKKQREEQVVYDLQVVEEKCQKVSARKEKVNAQQRHLESLELITSTEKIGGLCIVDLDDQLDLLQALKADLEIPKKSKHGNKPKKQGHLTKAYKQYIQDVPAPRATHIPSLHTSSANVDVTVSAFYEDDDEDEVDES
ncbi:hypothetical protein BDZ97DRAFT_1927884 [Flammula alnicola]|nr:hypothetical protein BDZ97DRAFT_1927884 [Flammula alnicola]